MIVELSQLGIGLLQGYSTRVVDINDLIFNLLGALFGYGIARLLMLAFLKLIAGREEKLGGFLTYIYERSR
ncbi:MAG: VanZ family protein [Clostridia bacterium]|nr:VanZ family protein [Clostridia bacterium]